MIRGKTAPRFFCGPGAKLGGKPCGHLFGAKLLGVVEARRRIYLPTYEWVLENCISHHMFELLLSTPGKVSPSSSATTATRTTPRSRSPTPPSWCGI